MTKVKIAEAERLLSIVSAQRGEAERRLAGCNSEIHATNNLLRAMSGRLAASPAMIADVSYPVFAEGKRASLRREAAGLSATLKALTRDQSQWRRNVERLLRQEISLKAMIDAAKARQLRAMARAESAPAFAMKSRLFGADGEAPEN